MFAKSGSRKAASPVRALLLIWLLVASAAYLLQELPILQRLEFQAYDMQLRYLRESSDRPANVEVALIGLDEAAYSAIEPPFALWHKELGELIAAANVAGAAVLAFDVVLPERSYDDFLERRHDQALLTEMVRARGKLPVIFGRTLNASGRLQDINKRFLAVMGREGFAMVNQVQELDGVVRRFVHDRFEADLGMQTLSGQMASVLGFTPQSGWIDYTIGENVRYVPMLDVLEWLKAWRENEDESARRSLEQALGGRAVFVGGVLPFVDRHFQPVILTDWGEPNFYAPGVLIHMQSFRSMASDRMVRDLPPWLMVGFVLLSAGFVLMWNRPVMGPLAVGVYSMIVLLLSAKLFEAGWRLPMVPLVTTAVLAWAVVAVWGAVINMQEKQRLKGAFSGYVSPEILKQILEGSIVPELGGESRIICVLFADICGFTTLSESLPAEKVLALLNRYFDRVTPVIHNHDGTLDKYMGDGIMALFGAPQDLDNAAQAAFDAAREMHQALDILNEELVAGGEAAIQIGIGLGMGHVVVGHVGAQSRFEYSAIGDAVNVAARVEGLTRKCACKVVVTERVYEDLAEQDRADCVYLGKQELKGHTPMAVYGWGPLEDRLCAIADEREQEVG